MAGLHGKESFAFEETVCLRLVELQKETFCRISLSVNSQYVCPYSPKVRTYRSPLSSLVRLLDRIKDEF